MEPKRTVLFGEDGKHKAEVTDEQLESDDRSANSSQLISKSGMLFTPDTYEYLGSAIVHYYSKEKLANNPNFVVVCQTVGIENITENHADIGWKALGTKLMACFGRKIPKVRGF